MDINGIIVEGPDHVGKTILSLSLSEALGWDYHHMTKPVGDPDWTDYTNQLVGGNILDRFHLGGYVYGGRLKLHPWMNAFYMRNILEDIRRKDYHVVVLYSASDEWLSDQLEHFGKEEMYSRDTILRANHEYRRIVQEDVEIFGYPLHTHGWDVSHGFPTQECICGIIEART